MFRRVQTTLVRAVSVAALLTALVGVTQPVAAATTIRIWDIVDLDSPEVFSGSGDTHSFTHNILTDVVLDGSSPSAIGYVPSTDTLLEAILTLTFSNANQGNDTVNIYFDSVLFNGSTFSLSAAVSSNDPTGISFDVMASLADGLLNVQLVKAADAGDFIFHGSVLTVRAERETTSVQIPEPGMLGLFGLGLAVFVVSRRRRIQTRDCTQ